MRPGISHRYGRRDAHALTPLTPDVLKLMEAALLDHEDARLRLALKDSGTRPVDAIQSVARPVAGLRR